MQAPEHDAPLPLSVEQESYLGLGRGGHGALPVCFRIRGELDRPVLQRALSKVVARHQPLRMRLLDTPGGPRQVFPLSEAEACVIEEVAVEHAAAAEATAARLAARPSDLRAHGPVRASLICWGAADMLLVLLLDHLASDAWSGFILGRELWTCYRAETAGTEPRLPAAPRFSDYVTAQRAAAATWAPAQVEYWRRVSRDYCEPADPPGTPGAPGAPDQPGRSDLVCGLDEDQMEDLLEFARAAVVPPRTVELAGPLLALWAWRPGPAIGAWCLHAGREDPALAQAVGIYVRTFPLVVRVDPAHTLANFSRNVLREWSQAVGYSTMPYSAGALWRMIAEAGGADPSRPEIRLNRLVPPRGMSQSNDPVQVNDSVTVEICNLEPVRWSWYRETRMRLMSTFDTSLSIRAIFNPGMMPDGFPEEMLGNLEMLLSLFTAEHADRPIGELVTLAGLSQ
jgi:hypothetical protein